MFAYCNNNPVMYSDPTGEFLDAAIEFIKNAVTEIGKVISSWSTAYSYCGQVAGIDGPAPYLDVVAALGTAVITAGAIGYGTYQTITSPPPISVPKVETKEKEVTLPAPPKPPVFIYRHNGTNPGNLVPSKRDVFYNSGLSFSTTFQPNSFCTTIDQINSTGILLAFQDKPNHVSVIPVNGTIAEWRAEGSSSQWTQTLLKVCTKIKWDSGK